MRYGLIGEKLGHSYSKIIHEKLADYTYDLIPLTKEEFVPFMQKKDFTAINVTIPYKQEVIPYLDELHPLASQIGAVNTIVNKSGYYIGYNTDFYGFQYMLTHNNIEISGKKCLIIGTGGTSHTVREVLKYLGADKILIVSRKNSEDTISQAEDLDLCKTISYETCYAEHTDAAIIINTTPLGMYPKVDASPLELTTFSQCEAVVDVIFNPMKTKLTLQAEELGIKAVTGLEMLVAQAKQAIEYFLDKKLEDKVIDDVYQELLKIID
ncbi:MAG: shikimate dehydrogenase [Herbinix sp.]|nr:shikimate dehydrogenase [Herbinix sp.]